ncbi:hypothetical protein IKF40_02170 [Candidatus Saccharibacteria bacterium]|nr:hypothetical protein [Candidatus Saccharibacteria bacterium]
MARPSKFNPQVAEKIIDFLLDGLSIKDACFGTDISESSFARYRQQNPKFEQAVQDALASRQWGCAEAVKKYHSSQRHYGKETSTIGINTRLEARKPLETALRSPEGQFEKRKRPQTYMGLPIRYEPLETYELDVKPFVNPHNESVEWVKDGILHRCYLDKWLEIHQPKPEPWMEIY